MAMKIKQILSHGDSEFNNEQKIAEEDLLCFTISKEILNKFFVLIKFEVML